MVNGTPGKWVVTCIICIEEYLNISLTDNQSIEKIVVNISLEEKINNLEK